MAVAGGEFPIRGSHFNPCPGWFWENVPSSFSLNVLELRPLTAVTPSPFSCFPDLVNLSLNDNDGSSGASDQDTLAPLPGATPWPLLPTFSYQYPAPHPYSPQPPPYHELSSYTYGGGSASSQHSEGKSLPPVDTARVCRVVWGKQGGEQGQRQPRNPGLGLSCSHPLSSHREPEQWVYTK